MTQSVQTAIPSYEHLRFKELRHIKIKYTIVILAHDRSGDSQHQETFLAPSVDNRTRNYDIEQMTALT